LIFQAEPLSERVVSLVRLLAIDAGIDEVRDLAAIDQIAAWCVQRYYAP
jgi:hypothetical protein